LSSLIGSLWPAAHLPESGTGRGRPRWTALCQQVTAYWQTLMA